MSNLHVIQLVLAWAVIFLPGVGTGGGGLTFWGRRGKCVICGENGKNTVLKRGAEKILLLEYYHIV